MIQFRKLFLVFLFNFIILACSKEPVETELFTDESVANATINTTLCDYSLSDIKPRSTLNINCTIDLKGKTIQLPTLTNFNFNGGQIINGTLIFSGGYIEGELLNSSLVIKGDARLKNYAFKFDKSKWNIKEGRVSSAIALNNTKYFKKMINLVKTLKGRSIEIDRLDAYFEVSKVTSTTTNRNFYPSIEGIAIPSNLIFRMSNNTHLRVQPNNNEQYSLLTVRDASNVTIVGGYLHGDRDEHNYQGDGSHEWGHTLDIHGSNNIKVLGVRMSNASGDGLIIHGLGFTFENEYIPSHQISIKNCVFDKSRRNNISVTDGYNINIENNTLLNAGIDTPNSSGTNPRFAIDIEAHRARNNAGDLVLYEKAFNIVIRNNTEKSSARGGFIASIGENVLMENNSIETSLSWGYASKTKIKNNTLRANAKFAHKTAIIGGRSNNTKTALDNEISGNRISGYKAGIIVYSNKNKVYDNTISNCQMGIFSKQLTNSKIYSNTITSSVPDSKGIFFHLTSLNNVEVLNNKVTTVSNAFICTSVNQKSVESNNNFTVQNNTFSSKSRTTISNSRGLKFEKNNLSNNLRITNASKTSIVSNTIKTNSTVGIDCIKVSSPVAVSNNKIDVQNTQHSKCIRTDSKSTSNIKVSNNRCL